MVTIRNDKYSVHTVETSQAQRTRRRTNLHRWNKVED